MKCEPGNVAHADALIAYRTIFISTWPRPARGRESISRYWEHQAALLKASSVDVPDPISWQCPNDPPPQRITKARRLESDDVATLILRAGLPGRGFRGLLGLLVLLPLAGHRQRRSSGGPDRGAVASHETTISDGRLYAPRRGVRPAMELHIGRKKKPIIIADHPRTIPARRAITTPPLLAHWCATRPVPPPA